MAHKAKLYIGSKKTRGGKDDGYTVIECEYELVQPVVENGQPFGNPMCGLIHFVIVSPDDNDPWFHNWINKPTEREDGTIVFTVSEGDDLSTKTLDFKSAFCVRLYEYFNGQNSGQMYTKITVSAETITINKASFKNNQH